MANTQVNSSSSTATIITTNSAINDVLSSSLLPVSWREKKRRRENTHTHTPKTNGNELCELSRFFESNARCEIHPWKWWNCDSQDTRIILIKKLNQQLTRIYGLPFSQQCCCRRHCHRYCCAAAVWVCAPLLLWFLLLRSPFFGLIRFYTNASPFAKVFCL